MDVFTSSTLSGLADSLRSIGYLEAVTAGVFGIAFGIAYITIRWRLTAGAPASWQPMLEIGARVALGSVFFVMGGLNGFLQFVPQHPSSLQDSCTACGPFLQGIASTGYLFPFIKATELVAGALLLLGTWVPLAVVLLAPIAVNIGLYHLFLDPAGLPIAVLIVTLQAMVAWSQRAVFVPLLRARVADAAPVVIVQRSASPAAIRTGVPQVGGGSLTTTG